MGVLRGGSRAAVAAGAGFIPFFDDRRRLQGQRTGCFHGGVARRLDDGISADFHGPVFRRNGQKGAVLLNFQTHARRLLDNEFVQSTVRRAVHLPTEVADARIVRVPVVIGKIAQRPHRRRADDTPFRPAPYDRDFHLGNDRLRRVRAFVVPERLHVRIIAPVAGIRRHDLCLARHAVVGPQVRHGQFQSTLEQGKKALFRHYPQPPSYP